MSRNPSLELGRAIVESLSPANSSAPRVEQVKVSRRQPPISTLSSVAYGTVVDMIIYESIEAPTRRIRSNGNLKASSTSEPVPFSRLQPIMDFDDEFMSILIRLDEGVNQLVVQKRGTGTFRKGERVKVFFANPMRVQSIGSSHF